MNKYENTLKYVKAPDKIMEYVSGIMLNDVTALAIVAVAEYVLDKGCPVTSNGYKITVERL